MTTKTKRIAMNLLKIVIGSLVFALSVNTFALPNNLGEGGVTGLTLLIYYTSNISPEITNIFFNSILLVIGYKYLDKETVYYTVVAVVLMSLFLKLTSGLVFQTEQTIVAALGAGAFMGLGIGLIMKGDGTTAGTAILAKLMNKYFGWNTSYALLFFDLLVVIPSILVIGLESVIFTIISLTLSTRILDFILEGFNPKKNVMIISEEYEAIAQQISEQIERGITVLDGAGYYQQEPRKILYVVISRSQLLPIQKIISDIDPKAFVIINDVQGVIGEGFTWHVFQED